MNYENPILTVDVVLLALDQGVLRVALLRRTQAPFDGVLALPGGYAHATEDVSTQATALRILKTKLGFVPLHLEQVYTASGPDRDPRGWSASVVYLALQPMTAMQNLADAGVVEIFAVAELPPLAFDHAVLVQTAVERLRAKAAYTTIAAHLLERSFTMTEVHEAFEAVVGQPINQANFRHKILKLDALEPAGTRRDVGRPAAMYQLKRDLAYFDRSVA